MELLRVTRGPLPRDVGPSLPLLLSPLSSRLLPASSFRRQARRSNRKPPDPPCTFLPAAKAALCSCSLQPQHALPSRSPPHSPSLYTSRSFFSSFLSSRVRSSESSSSSSTSSSCTSSASSEFVPSQESREVVAKRLREMWKTQRLHSVSVTLETPETTNRPSPPFSSSLGLTSITPIDDASLPCTSSSSSSSWNAVFGDTERPRGARRKEAFAARGRGDGYTPGDWGEGDIEAQKLQGMWPRVAHENASEHGFSAPGSSGRSRGTIVKVHHHRICGFIAPDDGGPHIFLHRDDCAPSSSSPSSSSSSSSPSSSPSSLFSPAGRRKARRASAAAAQGATWNAKRALLKPGQVVTFETVWDSLHNAPRAIHVAFDEDREGDAWRRT
uniref:CSD domain-containing protein n=1 Tax=Neospora caninum (strain Liverpool) TaxID=572307 RepID=A0A0F7UEW0_NEOCL|nr:TPA: hypothetical protein BN1204_033745 [Neospora caninum Liverpool]